MELTTEALCLEELARGLVCEIPRGWLEFPLEEVIGWHCIFSAIFIIARCAW